MNYLFVIFCLIVILILIKRRKIDFFFIGAICFILYNIHCIYGVVYISSHEHVGVYYYWSSILPQVYYIVLAQMVLLVLFMFFYDKSEKKRELNEEDNYFSLIVDEYSESVRYTLFKYACLIAWVIMLYNVFFKIGITNITASKSTVWQRVGSLYITSNWLGMASFTYGIRNKKWVLSILGTAPVLLHFFIGSRAYMVVLIIIFLTQYSKEIGNSIANYWKMLVGGGAIGIFVLAYKRMYEFIKEGDFESAFAVLLNPDTYAYISRMGEPRIVLANLNYIIENNLSLGLDGWRYRIFSFIPFLNDFIGTDGYRSVSSILIINLNSSYGLASNIWGEFWALGSYPFLFIMFIVWLELLKYGNHVLKRKDWSSNFILPIMGYTAFYVHRLDFLKLIGNYKTDVMASLIFIAIGFIFTRKTQKIRINRN